jgi:hypothetical protein
MFIDRAALAELCLRDLRQWPGCESVKEVGILAEEAGAFRVRVIDYGSSRKKLADRVAFAG